MSDQAFILPKWCSYEGSILTKEQLDHSYTFWTMIIMLSSPVANFGNHPLVTVLESNKTQSHLKNELYLLLQTSLENLYIFKAFLWLHAVSNEDPTFITFDHCTTFFTTSMKRHKNRYLSQRHPRTTDAQCGIRLHYTAENPLPLPNY